jgi:hypothetical protein
MIFADGDRNRSGRKTRPADESAAFDLDRRIAGKSVELDGVEVTKDQALLLFFQIYSLLLSHHFTPCSLYRNTHKREGSKLLKRDNQDQFALD